MVNLGFFYPSVSHGTSYYFNSFFIPKQVLRNLDLYLRIPENLHGSIYLTLIKISPIPNAYQDVLPLTSLFR